MAHICLPTEEWSQIVDSTRSDFGITDDVIRRVSLAGLIAGWSTVAVLVATVFAILKVWDGGAVFLFIITGIGPIVIGGITFSVLSNFLKARLAPGYSEYEAAEKSRLEEARKAFERQVMQTAEFWRSLDGHAFEREFARLLNDHGFEATVTSRSGDGGIDIVSRAREGNVAIQCKRYAKAVGPAVIRELYGAVKAGGYDLGILAVTGGVTKGVMEFAEGKPLRIIDLPEIVDMQMELNKAEVSEL